MIRPLAAVVTVALLLPTLAVVAAAADLLVTVGDVTATSAVIWVRHGGAKDVRLEYGAVGDASARATVAIRPDADWTGKLRLTRLRPGTRYGYRVHGATQSLDGRFVTAPADDADAPVSFVWSGDLGGQGACRRVGAGYPIFDTMTAHTPDFFLFLGDTVYADSRCDRHGHEPGADFVATTLPQYRDKHRYNRSDPAVQRFLRTASVYAIWDDHEVRNDFAGTVEPLMPVGRQAFLDYWPIESPPDEPGRLYRRARWGRLMELFILDTRQYRSDNRAPDGPAKTMLGAAQRRWLIERLGASTAVWKLVATSVSLSVPTGAPHARDSWSNASIFGLPEEGGTGFATERDAILQAIRAKGIRNVVFLSADVHYAMIARHAPHPGFAVHEMIAGPLSARHGRPVPLDDALNPHVLFERGGINNVGAVAIDTAGLTVRIVAEDGATLFTHTLPPR